MADKLTEYRKKRDTGRSGEPSGKGSRRSRGKRPRFVVQQHDATSNHYDFRLESGGVLKSWAVPKGPSADPGDKRLAMPTEDHPLSYAGFEGLIPAGEYGAGPVIVWDTGTYTNETEDPAGHPVDVGPAIEHGHVKFCLNGQKLRGRYTLTRMGGGGRERWLLVKMADEHAARKGHPAEDAPESVKSGRTIGEVAGDAKRHG
jgi:bifunctional non-homologous end joining protein LigD